MVFWCDDCGRAFEVGAVARPKLWLCSECRPPGQVSFDFGENTARMPAGYPAMLGGEKA